MKSEKFKVPKVFKDLKDLKFYGINSLFNCYFDSFLCRLQRYTVRGQYG